ncbi:MAG: substrate-binding domain-containing protein [Alphaproteobacteria bacterium]|nr:substrate-binding domain-containing protein [Alphaproteobacteria bacterium]
MQIAGGEPTLGTIPDAANADDLARIVGYNDMASIVGAITQKVEARHPGMHFDLVLKSTRSAPPALLDGSSLLAPMGAEMLPAESTAFTQRWCYPPVMFRVAHDSLTPGALSSPLGVLVRNDSPLHSISMRALRRLFTDTSPGLPITRWNDLLPFSDLGNQPIHPIGLAADTAIGRYLLKGPLKAPDFGVSFHGERQSRDVAAAVAGDRLAIGLADLNMTSDRLRALTIIDDNGIARAPNRATIQSGHYPLDRFLMIYARRDCSGGVDPHARMVLNEIMSDAGQAIIRADPLGYIPLNRTELRAERAKLKALPPELTASTTKILAGLTKAWKDDFNHLHDRLRVVVAPDPAPPLGKRNPGLEHFLEGQGDIAFLSREISEADLATFRDHHRGAAPIILPVANGAWNSFGKLDAVVIVVNPANPVRQLSLRQIDAIFSSSLLRGGRAAHHWGDVGVRAWQNRPIHIAGGDAWSGEESARALTLRRHVMSYRGLHGRWISAAGTGNDASVGMRVAADPLAIGFTGFGHVSPAMRVVPVSVQGQSVLPNKASIMLGRYPLARTIDMLFYRPKGACTSPSILNVAHFLLGRRAQRLIAKSSTFLPLGHAQIGKARAFLERLCQ